MKNLINSINQLFNNSLKPKLQILDTKITTLIPNSKLKKILYIAVGSLFAFMFLIILLGLIFSPLKNSTQETSNTVKKINIISESPKSQTQLTELQKQILDLETEVKEMKFPPSILNVPNLESDIKI
jgi:hypothetical protein